MYLTHLCRRPRRGCRAGCPCTCTRSYPTCSCTGSPGMCTPASPCTRPGLEDDMDRNISISSVILPVLLLVLSRQWFRIGRKDVERVYLHICGHRHGTPTGTGTRSARSPAMITCEHAVSDGRHRRRSCEQMEVGCVTVTYRAGREGLLPSRLRPAPTVVQSAPARPNS